VHPRSIAANGEPNRNESEDFRQSRTAVAHTLVVPVREAVPPRLARIRAQELDQLLRLSHRQHAEHERVDQAEDCRVRTDAERQRHDGNRREPVLFDEHPNGKSEVLNHVVQGGSKDPPYVWSG